MAEVAQGAASSLEVMMKLTWLLLGLLGSTALANPYFDPKAVPLDDLNPDTIAKAAAAAIPIALQDLRSAALPALRVLINWEKSDNQETYTLASAVLEQSGTETLYARAQHLDPHGSYQAKLTDKKTHAVIGYAAIGTGSSFRLLTRALSFRFPAPKGDSTLTVYGENPINGVPELILQQDIPMQSLQEAPVVSDEAAIEVKTLQESTQSPALVVNVYADGYKANRKEAFWQHAAKVVEGLKSVKFPYLQRMTIRAVFAPSNQALGSARDLGLPVKRYDSFLGLFFPYWHNFGRWYHVVYPTDEGYFRQNIAVAPYDHPIVLLDDSNYWGIGNFNELTAIPGGNSGSFTYLLAHEFGHYFGLNEEYEGGGPTELAFAPNIAEPWSQNITFLPQGQDLKWKPFVSDTTPVPTPRHVWRGQGPYGAYKGGYADSQPLNKSHKPGFACVMESFKTFCPVCEAALKHRLQYDLGESAF